MDLNMSQALQEYQNLVEEVERRCQRILSRHRDQIVCAKGCAGNCCRIHLSLFPVEAVSLAAALGKLASAERERVQHIARQTNSFGPCPLLKDGVCRMYDARAVICRTHGLPMATEYRGRRSIGYCEKNFRSPSPLPEADIIDLNALNHSLAKVNQRFVRAAAPGMSPGHRFTIGEALLLNRNACDFNRI